MDGETFKERRQIVPEIYNKDTKLTAELTAAPRQTFDFALSGNAAK